MTELPEAASAIVDERKIREYLLADDHPAGRAKAAFFRQFGFRTSSWRNLRTALLAHAREARVVSAVTTEFGKKYVLDGPIGSPDGRTPRLRTIWFVATDETRPRLVTAYPMAGGDR
jgi:hypothetical protein